MTSKIGDETRGKITLKRDETREEREASTQAETALSTAPHPGYYAQSLAQGSEGVHVTSDPGSSRADIDESGTGHTHLAAHNARVDHPSTVTPHLARCHNRPTRT